MGLGHLSVALNICNYRHVIACRQPVRWFPYPSSVRFSAQPFYVREDIIDMVWLGGISMQVKGGMALLPLRFAAEAMIEAVKAQPLQL